MTKSRFPRFGRAAQAPRDRKGLMLTHRQVHDEDTPNIIADYSVPTATRKTRFARPATASAPSSLVVDGSNETGSTARVA